MQRKSSILKQQRRGFAMIMAIFFMVLIATLLSYMLAATTETGNRGTNTYLNEQAQLLAKSAVEYALLRVSGYPRATNDCLKNFDAVYPDATSPMFNIHVDVNYYGFGGTCAGNGTTGSISTAESNGTMLIDVYVKSNTAVLNIGEPISYHRRTLQKL